MTSKGLCDPIQGTTKESIGVEKFCENGRCGNLTESSIGSSSVIDNEKASCSQSEKNSILESRANRCDSYGLTHSECAKYVSEELERSCGGSYNCIDTARGDWASWKTYAAMTPKFVNQPL